MHGVDNAGNEKYGNGNMVFLQDGKYPEVFGPSVIKCENQSPFREFNFLAFNRFEVCGKRNDVVSSFQGSDGFVEKLRLRSMKHQDGGFFFFEGYV